MADSVEVSFTPPCSAHAPPFSMPPGLETRREGKRRGRGKSERGACICAASAPRNNEAASFTAVASAQPRAEVSRRSSASAVITAAKRRARAIERTRQWGGKRWRHWRPRTHACSSTAEATARGSQRRASSARACACSNTAEATAQRKRWRASHVCVRDCTSTTAVIVRCSWRRAKRERMRR